MKLVVFTIYDKAVQAYNTPFYMQTEGEAMRGFKQVCTDPQTNICKHPEDFALFKLGWFDNSTGQFELVEPECVARAHEVKALEAARSIQESIGDKE